METLKARTKYDNAESRNKAYNQSVSNLKTNFNQYQNPNHVHKIFKPKNAKINVRIHYKRFGNDYNGWNIWSWQDNKKGKTLNFTNEDSFGMIAKTELEPNSDKLKFIIQRNNWQEKDVHFDREISLKNLDKNNNLDIYLVQGEPKVFYKLEDVPKNLRIENYFGNDLGVSFNPNSIDFKVWAPTANKAELLLYQKDDEKNPFKVIPMDSTQGSTWSAKLPKKTEGLYYTFSIDGREAVDPYTKAVGANGVKGQIIDLEKTNPKDWHKDSAPKFENKTDSIIYEIHPRHFTIDQSSGVKPEYKGKFLGLTQKGTKNSKNQSTGLDHLKELGITHVQLMPSFDFGSVDETQKNTDRGNWGYDPLNWNVPEGSYSTNPHKGDVRIKEYKELVKTFHDNNIGVIMDVVYPHTYKRDDSHLNKIVPDYYYRKTPDGNHANGSGCGNEIASEKPMARKMIVDSVIHWAKEYHIDGFRFDQMSLLDKKTMYEIKTRLDKEVRPGILLYGEGWDRSQTIPHHLSAHQDNYKDLRGIGFFNNCYSNAIRGDFNGNGDKGLSHENGDKAHRVTVGLKADVPYGKSPEQSINYVGCHDNLTFWDNINKNLPASEHDKISAFKMGYALKLVSQGIPFVSEADEFLRTKHGKHNTYNDKDSINRINWEDKEKHAHINEYLKGLIHLRRNYRAFRSPSPSEIQNKVHTHSDGYNNTIKMVMDGHVNNDIIRKFEVHANYSGHRKEISLSENNNWTVLVNHKKAGHESIANFHGNKYVLPPRSVVVLADTESYEKMIKLRKKKNIKLDAKDLGVKMLQKKKSGNFNLSM